MFGAVTLHAGIAACAMQAEPPAVMPPQQVIRIAMVAPSAAREEIRPQPRREVRVRKPPTAPPKPKGMFQAKPIPRPAPVIRNPEPREATPQKPDAARPHARITSGAQSAQATETAAALTEPVAADYLQNPPPEYPYSARRRKQQGMVMLNVRVRTDGRPRSVRIARSSGYDALDEAALYAVRRWKFVPARRGSERIEASVTVPVHFRIN